MTEKERRMLEEGVRFVQSGDEEGLNRWAKETSEEEDYDEGQLLREVDRESQEWFQNMGF